MKIVGKLVELKVFLNLKVLKVKNLGVLKIGDCLTVEGISLVIIGHSGGCYLAWSGPGTTIYRIE